ncbi:Os02g0507000 [Oryza sativa Japonica Group]|uniref:Os02g0507000 protein n=1 Tax=Oryza sativa subsp. japonica TaxID=39947 RepID=A0A0P0VJE5_ORYSJ|nr:Os02g0507000 [Oryza sativa Japonica Group]
MPLPLAPASPHPPGRDHADVAAEGFGSLAALVAAGGGGSDAALALKLCKAADVMHKAVGAPSKVCKMMDLTPEGTCGMASVVRCQHWRCVVRWCDSVGISCVRR